MPTNFFDVEVFSEVEGFVFHHECEEGIFSHAAAISAGERLVKKYAGRYVVFAEIRPANFDKVIAEITSDSVAEWLYGFAKPELLAGRCARSLRVPIRLLLRKLRSQLNAPPNVEVFVRNVDGPSLGLSDTTMERIGRKLGAIPVEGEIALIEKVLARIEDGWEGPLLVKPQITYITGVQR